MAALLVLVFGYVLAATYAFKLIPLYGGSEGRTSLASITSLYGHQVKTLTANLDYRARAAAIVFALTGIVILLVIAQQALLIRGIIADAKGNETAYWTPSGRFRNPDRA